MSGVLRQKMSGAVLCSAPKIINNNRRNQDTAGKVKTAEGTYEDGNTDGDD